MDKNIELDLFRYGGLKGFRGLMKGLIIPGFRYSFFFRKASFGTTNKASKFIYKVILRHYSYKFGIQIPPGTKIGPGFYIGHFGNIIINPKVSIGKNCNVSPGVTIGQASGGKLKGCPVIGDSVWIGTNSVIVGRITIGDDVLIAPGSFVNFDVPSNSLVVGHKCQIIEKNNATENQINFKV